MTPTSHAQEEFLAHSQPGLKLAICIPTYNRAPYIERALKSVLDQTPAEGVEIVVVDNHSTDDTEAIVARFMQQHANIRYFKRELNVGADRNVLEAGEYSRSEYFWIFGSDDSMPPGAMEQVLHAIADGVPNLVLGDANDCDIELRQTGMLKFLRCGARDFDFAKRQDVDAYLDAVTMTASLFGYISSMVFKRAAWDQVPISLYTLGTAYPQVFRALDVVFRAGGGFRYLAVPIADNRRNNCSYTEEFGEMLRYLIDFRMFRIVIDEYFSHDLRMRNRFKHFVRSCFGRMGQETIRTGMYVMDELLKFFERDDSVMPEIKSWERYPLVQRAVHRLQQNGLYGEVFEGRQILHLGYRHEGEATTKPVNRGAVGVDPGFSGYDGVRLPFETAGQDTIYLSDYFPGKADIGLAAAEWMRVLRPNGCMVISNGLRDGVSIASILAGFEAGLPARSYRVTHCHETVTPNGAEVDIVLQRVVPLQSVEQLMLQASELHATGNVRQAEAHAGQVLEREPRNTAALQLLGLIAYQEGRHADAILRFTAALTIDAGLLEARLNLGCAYAALGGNVEAMQCFAAILEQRPDFTAAAQNLALLRGSAAQHDALRGNFTQLLQAHPLLEAARQTLGQP